MRPPITWSIFVGAALAALALPAPGAAQSLLGIGGLGVPLDAVDARSRALGNPGIGLFGPSVLPGDPAAAADLAIPAVSVTFQSSWIDLEGEVEPDAVATRFPLVSVAYPVFEAGMATLTFGGFMDQRWELVRQKELDLGEAKANVTDRFLSDGGISAIRLGFARRVLPRLSLGVSVGTYTGNVSRRFTRFFDSLSVEASVPPLNLGGLWSFSGPTATFGARFDLSRIATFAGSVTWSGTLEADPSADTEGGAAEFDVPTRYRLGASGALLPGLNLVAGLDWADWSGKAETNPELGGSASLGYGFGLEWAEAGLFGLETPIRLGYRFSEFPFRFDGDDPEETAFTGGIGFNFVQAGTVPLARVDVAVERGDRSAASLSEEFWRATVSMRVAGF